jgi:zinc protease
MVLASGRASRLYRNVRDAGLASSVSASNHTPVEIGVFGIHAEVDPAVVLPAAEAIWAELRNVLEFGVLHDEVHRAQRILQSSWLRRLESMDGQAMWLASWESLGGFRMGSEYFEKMMLLSPADVTDVARRYLHLEQMSVVAYRPRGTKAIAANAEEMFNLLNNAATTPQAVRTEHLPEPAVFSRKQPRLQQVCGPVRLFHSEGGVPILVRRAPGSPLFHASLHCMGGAGADSAAAAGLTLLAARAATKGTQRRTAEQIADEVESHGGSLGASVGSEGFGWSVSSPLQYRSTMTDILADVAQNAVFSERAVEAERAALLGEIALARDDMFRQPVRLAMEGAFGGHPYGRAVHGDEKTVARIGASDLHEWRTRRTQSGQFTLAAVADVEEEELAAELATAFAALQYTAAPGLDAPRWPGNEVHRAENRDKEQTAIAVLFPSAARRDDNRFAANLLATIGSGLGGRFFDELRDRQSLAYTVHAHTVERLTAGAFVAYIATSPAREEVALEGILNEIAKLRNEPVSEEELARACEFMIGARAIRLQSGSAMLGEMLDAWAFGGELEELNEMEARLRSVTASQLLNYARENFDPLRKVVGIVRGNAKV